MSVRTTGPCWGESQGGTGPGITHNFHMLEGLAIARPMYSPTHVVSTQVVGFGDWFSYEQYQIYIHPSIYSLCTCNSLHGALFATLHGAFYAALLADLRGALFAALHAALHDVLHDALLVALQTGRLTPCKYLSVPRKYLFLGGWSA